MRKFTYYVPVEVKFTKTQIAAIVRENMENWGIDEDAAKDCCDEDYLLAASRLGLVSLPSGTRFDEEGQP